MFLLDLLSKSLQVDAFEVGDTKASPPLCPSDEGSKGKLEDRSFAEEGGHGLGAASFLLEETFEQVRGADDTAVAWRALQVSDACIEVVQEAADGSGVTLLVTLHEVVTKQLKQCQTETVPGETF